MLNHWLIVVFMCGFVVSCTTAKDHVDIPEYHSATTHSANKVTVNTNNTPPVAYFSTISEQDLLEVNVFKVPDLSRTVRVDDAGNISLPLIKTVHVKGLTARQVEKKLSDLLQKTYLRNPQVSVFVKESTLRRITVEGSVKSTGVFPMKGKTTFLQAIAQAGGLNEFAAMDNIILFRTEGVNNIKKYRVDLKSIRLGKADDINLKADDRIVVNESVAKRRTKTVTDTVRGFISPFSLFGTP